MNQADRADLPALLCGLPEAVRAGLGARPITRADAGTMLLEEGAQAERLWLLLGGSVELCASGAKGEAVVRLVSPGEPFILAAAMTGRPCLMSARALTPARLLSVSAAALRREAARSAMLAARLTHALAAESRGAVRQIKDLKLRDGAQRVGGFLLDLVQRDGCGGVASLPVTKAKLASRLGISAGAFSRSLAVLRGHGLVVRGGRVAVIDGPKLQAFCRR